MTTETSVQETKTYSPQRFKTIELPQEHDESMKLGYYEDGSLRPYYGEEAISARANLVEWLQTVYPGLIPTTDTAYNPEKRLNPADYPQMVADAAIALDNFKPNWYSPDHIDIDTFDMGSGSRCVLGQIFGDVTTGIRRLYGIELPLSMVAFGNTEHNKVDTLVWLKEILDRRLRDVRQTEEYLVDRLNRNTQKMAFRLGVQYGHNAEGVYLG